MHGEQPRKMRRFGGQCADRPAAEAIAAIHREHQRFHQTGESRLAPVSGGIERKIALRQRIAQRHGLLKGKRKA